MATGISKGDRVKVEFEATVIEVRSDGASFETRDDAGQCNSLSAWKVARIVPSCPPRGSLVRIDGMTYFVHYTGKLARVWDDGSMSEPHATTNLRWEDIYKPGYKVAQFV